MMRQPFRGLTPPCLKIGIFCEPHQAALGGSEYCVAVLAEAFRRSHDVEIVSHRAQLTADEMSRLFGTELDGVTVRHIPFAGRATWDRLMSGGVFARQNNGWRS